ncbi:MAG: DUF3048 domain-containing protein [Candidatus Dormibacteraeota bacterium]|nr:DUF3048 domain-containing protein [Candidatus Dormibacteraeota bacterium]
MQEERPATSLRSRRALLALATVALTACGSVVAHPPASPHASRSALPVETVHIPAGSSQPARLPAPVIVQVENAVDSRPQSGLSFASVVYEYVAEGGIGRFSAIYDHPSAAVPIGPVRSARLAAIHALNLYQAVLLYSGASQHVQSVLESSATNYFDETSARGALFRISSRVPPHNLYTDGAHVAALLDRVKPGPISYQPYSSQRPLGGGTPVTHFTVPISASETPQWTWDTTAGGWLRSESDTGKSIDADTNRQLMATTVVVQQVQITVTPFVEDVNGVHGRDHTLTGSGKAQVFVDGKEYDATWTQPGNGPPRLTLANGQPAPMALGSVWFELVATGASAQLG